MTVKQISVFVENKPGKLAELTDYLNQQDIDMRALSIAEASGLWNCPHDCRRCLQDVPGAEKRWICSVDYSGSGGGDER